ncbi:MAG: ABC transporter substrate-binding protein, partial [Chloroflexi bacterium]|nr:ABC transporter substrate-binding protein [Chloroflexota bacterium]
MDVVESERRALNRRGFLLGALSVGSMTVLAACGGGGGTSAPATSAPAGGAATTAPAATKPAAAASPAGSPAAAASPAAGASPAASPAAAAAASPAASPAAVAAASPAASPAAAPAASPAASPGVVGSPSPVAGGAAAFTLNNPPAVANAAQAKQYASQKITYYGDGVGIGNDIDKALAQRFTQDTGVQVNVIARPQSSSDSFAQYQRFFQGQSADIDVLMIDVIWPGQLAPNLLDLTQSLATEAKNHYPNIIENNTIDGKLVAIPWFGDVGMLYYRSDLLKKYNFNNPPATWDELGQQATAIMNGEKGSNANFSGFVYQGNAYEGLTCNGIEWFASTGGGTIVDQSNKVTVNNPQAVAIMNLIKGWVGTVSPRGVTGYQEEDARNAF